MSRRKLNAAALALLISLGCGPRPRPAHGETPREPSRSGLPARPTISVARLRDLSIQAIGSPMADEALARAHHRIADGTTTVEDFVDSLLNDRRFSHRVAPLIVKGDADSGTEAFWGSPVLLHFDAAGGPVHYLREPCSPDDAIEVRPWWAMDAPIRVCPEAYRPSVIVSPDNGHHCSSPLAAPWNATGCGCGPNLAFCGRPGSAEELQRDAFAELRDTIGHFVAHDRPLAEIFTSNATVRRPNVEFYYRRGRILNGESVSLDDLAAWPEEGQLAPRHESVVGQHAGITTGPTLVFFEDSPRSRMRQYFEMLMCIPADSSRVDASAVLSIEGNDLRSSNDGWERLATMPVCTNCHARLDHAARFFSGYGNPYHAPNFISQWQGTGPGALYIDDIDDLRGTATRRSPRALMELLVAQDEFGDCMTSKVVEHVFGAGAPAKVSSDVRQALRRSKTFKAMMRAALLAYADGHQSPRPSTATRAASEPSDRSAAVALSGSLRHRIDAHCIECHGEADVGAPLLSGETLSRTVALQALSAVATGRMPRDTPLEGSARATLIQDLIAALWQEPDARRVAAEYHLGGWRASATHRAQHLPAIASAAAGGSGSIDVGSLLTIENTLPQAEMVYTPGVAISVAALALHHCKRAHAADLAQCMARVGDPGLYLKTMEDDR